MQKFFYTMDNEGPVINSEATINFVEASTHEEGMQKIIQEFNSSIELDEETESRIEIEDGEYHDCWAKTSSDYFLETNEYNGVPVNHTRHGNRYWLTPSVDVYVPIIIKKV